MADMPDCESMLVCSQERWPTAPMSCSMQRGVSTNSDVNGYNNVKHEVLLKYKWTSDIFQSLL